MTENQKWPKIKNRQQWSAFGWPPLPPSSAIVSICRTPPSASNSTNQNQSNQSSSVNNTWVGHKGWKGQSQAGLKGLRLEFGTQKAPRLLEVSYFLVTHHSSVEANIHLKCGNQLSANLGQLDLDHYQGSLQGGKRRLLQCSFWSWSTQQTTLWKMVRNSHLDTTVISIRIAGCQFGSDGVTNQDSLGRQYM